MKSLTALLTAAVLIAGAANANARDRQATTAAEDNALSWSVVQSPQTPRAYAQAPTSVGDDFNRNTIDFQATGGN